jgi:transposase
MSLKPHPLDHVPEETARVARAVFPKGHVSIRMRDAFGALYSDEVFAPLFSRRGQPAEAPGRLALVTVMPFAEGLSDRQAADAVRRRIDWKYALALEWTDPGFDASVLSEFRGRLIAGQAEQWLCEALLPRCREAGLLKPRGRQRTDSTHVLAAVQALNRLECVGETMRHALNVLAVVAPDWLLGHVPADWCARYGRRFEDDRLPPGRPERDALAETIGTDGFHLLGMLDEESAPRWLREVPAVEMLRQVWVPPFDAPVGPVRWRAAEDLPPSAKLICSPDDAEARYSKKRSTEWTGDKGPVTDTCDDETPHLMTDVQTTPAPTADFDVPPTIQADVAARELLPSEHIVDAGYVSADHLVTSQQLHGVTRLGPVPPDVSWQAKAHQGFDVATVVIDWDSHTATCPQGRKSVLWVPGQDRHGHEVMHMRFARADCAACTVRDQCTHAAGQPRLLTVRTRAQHEALQAARQRQATDEFQKTYAVRAGVEGTLSQGVRDGDLRRSRYLGLAKTHLQHLATAAAIHLLRVGAWLAEVPRAQTRKSPFHVLAMTGT